MVILGIDTLVFKLLLLVVILGLVVCSVVIYIIRSVNSIDVVEHFCMDKNPLYLHIMGHKKMRTDHSKGATIHYVYNVDTKKFHRGAKTKSEIDLSSNFNSDFLQASFDKMKIDSFVGLKMDSSTSKKFQSLFYQDRIEITIDTYKIIVKEFNEMEAKSKLELYKGDLLLTKLKIDGIINRNSQFILNKDKIFFTYQKGNMYFSRIGLGVIDLTTNKLELKKRVR